MSTAKIIFLALTIAIGLTACKKDDEVPTWEYRAEDLQVGVVGGKVPLTLHASESGQSRWSVRVFPAAAVETSSLHYSEGTWHLEVEVKKNYGVGNREINVYLVRGQYNLPDPPPPGDIIDEITIVQAGGKDITPLFTDPAFQKIAVQTGDQDRDGRLSDTEGLEVREIRYSYNYDGDLFSVAGINELKNLISVELYVKTLESVRLDGLTKLEYFSCSHNPALKEFMVEDCGALRELHVDYCQVETLNLDGLSNLEILYCDENDMTELSLQGCSGLKRLYASVNQLTSVDLSDCTELVYANLDLNLGLTTLDISRNPQLKGLQTYWIDNLPVIYVWKGFVRPDGFKVSQYTVFKEKE